MRFASDYGHKQQSHRHTTPMAFVFFFGDGVLFGGCHQAIQMAFSNQEECLWLFKTDGFSPSARQAMA